MKKIALEEIALEEWIAKKVASLSAFRVYWAQMNYSDPDDFPREIPEGDWEEQFDFWREEV
jgi:hypothetical protein